MLEGLFISCLVVNLSGFSVSNSSHGRRIDCVSFYSMIIYFFNRVVPQALCTRYGLAIGSSLAP